MPAFISIHTGNTISGVMSGLDLGSNSCYQPHIHTHPTFCHSHSFLKCTFSVNLPSCSDQDCIFLNEHYRFSQLSLAFCLQVNRTTVTKKIRIWCFLMVWVSSSHVHQKNYLNDRKSAGEFISIDVFKLCSKLSRHNKIH